MANKCAPLTFGCAVRLLRPRAVENDYRPSALDCVRPDDQLTARPFAYMFQRFTQFLDVASLRVYRRCRCRIFPGLLCRDVDFAAPTDSCFFSVLSCCVSMFQRYMLFRPSAYGLFFIRHKTFSGSNKRMLHKVHGGIYTMTVIG